MEFSEDVEGENMTSEYQPKNDPPEISMDEYKKEREQLKEELARIKGQYDLMRGILVDAITEQIKRDKAECPVITETCQVSAT